MTTLPIRRLGDPVLKEPAREVERFDATLRALYRDMLETMYAAPGVGLAAPQVGISLRFFVYDDRRGNGPGALANPELVRLDGEHEDEEGCLSIPGLYFPTRRALHAAIRGQDLDGSPVSLRGDELLARIFQHEIDHLDGLLFIDRLGREERRQAFAAMRELELGGASTARARRERR